MDTIDLSRTVVSNERQREISDLFAACEAEGQIQPSAGQPSPLQPRQLVVNYTSGNPLPPGAVSGGQATVNGGFRVWGPHPHNDMTTFNGEQHAELAKHHYMLLLWGRQDPGTSDWHVSNDWTSDTNGIAGNVVRWDMVLRTDAALSPRRVHWNMGTDCYNQPITFEYFPVGLHALQDHILLCECGAKRQRGYLASDEATASAYDKAAWKDGGFFDAYRYHISQTEIYTRSGHRFMPNWHL